MEQNDIGFITVAICGGYISKYPRLYVVIFNEVLYTNPPLSIIPQNYKCIPNLNNVWPFLLTFTGLQTLLITLDLLKKNKHTVVYGHIRTTLETEFMFDNMVRASDVPNVKYILCKMTV